MARRFPRAAPNSHLARISSRRGSSRADLLLPRLRLLLAAIPGLQCRHAPLADVGVSRVEGVQVFRAHDGRQLHLLCPVPLGLPVRGSDDDW